MLADISGLDNSRRLSQGVYQSRWWNFELELRGHQMSLDLDHPDLPDDFPGIGVCDSPEQLLSALPDAVANGPTPYVISMVRIDKAGQPEDGGWRWHKWGEYVGVRKPQCEYLFDEPDIDTVWTYHIYELDPNSPRIAARLDPVMQFVNNTAR